MKSVFNRLSIGLATAMIVLAQVVMPVQAAFADDNGKGGGNSNGDNGNGNKVVTNPQIVMPTTQSISAKALTDHECNTTEWHFVITQVDMAANAPASISVSFGNGSTVAVQLDKVTGGTAHYLTTQNLNSTVTSATATIYAGWTGQFNLSHGPCTPVQEDKTKVTAVNGTFSDKCGTAFNLTFAPAVTEGVTYNAVQTGNTVNVTATAKQGYTLTDPNWKQSQTDQLTACPVIKPCTANTKTTVSKYEDFADYNDTRATGHTEFLSNGLHIWTEGATSTDKVAWYNIVTPYSLADIGTPSIEYTNTAGGVPGMQLLLDFDGDGSTDGTLVGESVYGADWWLTDGSKQFVKDGAPSHTGGSGSTNHGTLNQWLVAFPNAKVTVVGFSLGSGVKGDGVLKSLTFGCQTWEFKKAPQAPKVCPANEEWYDMNKNTKVDEGECFKKVFVCKYVGTPGPEERLQTGNNPINVSVNAIPNYQGIGSYFADKHGRSYVLAVDYGQDEPSIDECPGTVVTPPVEVFTPATCIAPATVKVTYDTELYEYTLQRDGFELKTNLESGVVTTLETGSYTVRGYSLDGEEDSTLIYEKTVVATLANGCGGGIKEPKPPVVPVVPGKGSVVAPAVTELPETGAGSSALLIGLLAAAAAYGAVYFAQSKRQYE